MHVLIAVSSKHGSTRGIADAIAEVLTERGNTVDVSKPQDVANLGSYGAVIVGSAVYMAKWMGDAKEFVSNNAEALGDIPVWLFSSGLSDAPAKDANSSGERDVRDLLPTAKGHRHFSGALDLSQLSIPERAIIAAARGKYGDHRNFDAVKEWAGEIADQLN